MKQRSGSPVDVISSDRDYFLVKDKDDKPIRYFKKIHYRCPFKIKVYREFDYIVFNTPFMKIDLGISMAEDKKERLPTDFCRLILGFNRTHAPRIDVYIHCYYKWPAFILPWNWKYFKTFRLIKQELKLSFSSFHYFYNTFNWKSIYFQSRAIENMINRKTPQLK